MNGAGGYTGGNRQVAPENSMHNGMAGSSTQPNGMTGSFDGAGGSGYFEKADDFLNGKDFAGPLGGRRKLYQDYNFKFYFFWRWRCCRKRWNCKSFFYGNC